jgi:hypothetical protein
MSNTCISELFPEPFKPVSRLRLVSSTSTLFSDLKLRILKLRSIFINFLEQYNAYKKTQDTKIFQFLPKEVKMFFSEPPPHLFRYRKQQDILRYGGFQKKNCSPKLQLRK